jgi:hypothetical protein
VQVADPALFQEIARYYHSRQMAAYREEMRDRARQANGVMGGMGAVGPAEERESLCPETGGPLRDRRAIRHWRTRSS